jgi:hypothetical protein
MVEINIYTDEQGEKVDFVDSMKEKYKASVYLGSNRFITYENEFIRSFVYGNYISSIMIGFSALEIYLLAIIEAKNYENSDLLEVKTGKALKVKKTKDIIKSGSFNHLIKCLFQKNNPDSLIKEEIYNDFMNFEKIRTFYVHGVLKNPDSRGETTEGYDDTGVNVFHKIFREDCHLNNAKLCIEFFYKIIKEIAPLINYREDGWQSDGTYRITRELTSKHGKLFA